MSEGQGACSGVEACLDALLDHYRGHAPVRATLLGDTAVDGELDDWDERAVDARLRDLGEVERGLTHFAAQHVDGDPDDHADVSLLVDEVAALRHELEVAQVPRRDPRLYLDAVIAGVGELLGRDDVDATALAARLAAVPRLLDQASRNLDEVSAPRAEAAGGDLARAREIVDRAGPHAPEEAEGALRALSAWGAWLEEAPASGDWRLGPDGWRAAARAQFGIDVDPERLWAQAESRLAASDEEVARLSARVLAETTDVIGARPDAQAPIAPRGAQADPGGAQADPGGAQADPGGAQADPGGAQAAARGQTRQLDSALATLTRDRPPRSEWLAVAAGIVVEVAAHVAAGGLFPPAPAHPLRLQAVSAGSGGLARLRPPPPLRPEDPAVLEVAVPDEDGYDGGWSTPSPLGGGDVHALRAAVLHEVHPGHHLHVAHLHAHPRRVRRVLRSTVTLEGWALHAERVAAAAADWGPGPLLARAVMDRWTSAEALADVALHVRGWGPLAAERLLVERGHLDRPRARRAVARIQRDPVRRSVYAVGAEEIAALRGRWELGDAGFHASVLDAGAPPPRALPGLLARAGGRRRRPW